MGKIIFLLKIYTFTSTYKKHIKTDLQIHVILLKPTQIEIYNQRFLHLQRLLLFGRDKTN